VIAASDLFMYWAMERPYKETSSAFRTLEKDGNLLKDNYMNFVEYISEQYVYVLPKVGIPNFELIVAVNRYLLMHHMGYKATLGYLTDERKLLKKMITMLQKDLPVILLIGMPFPQLLHHTIWSKKKVGINFYTQTEEKGVISYKIANTAVKGHFVVVTGILIDSEAKEKQYKVMLRISSWGKEYYVSYYEYCKFEMKYGVDLQGSIIHIS